MKRSFVLTPEATADLREILLDIAEDSQTFQRLAQSPATSHYHDELLDRRYRFLNLYSYVICYVWERKPIQIICVVHGARDLAQTENARSLNLETAVGTVCNHSPAQWAPRRGSETARY